VAGNPRFDADRSEVGHADHFWAHMLAIHAGSGQARVYDWTPAPPRAHGAGRSEDDDTKLYARRGAW